MYAKGRPLDNACFAFARARAGRRMRLWTVEETRGGKLQRTVRGLAYPSAGDVFTSHRTRAQENQDLADAVHRRRAGAGADLVADRDAVRAVVRS